MSSYPCRWTTQPLRTQDMSVRMGQRPVAAREWVVALACPPGGIGCVKMSPCPKTEGRASSGGVSPPVPAEGEGCCGSTQRWCTLHTRTHTRVQEYGVVAVVECGGGPPEALMSEKRPTTTTALAVRFFKQPTLSHRISPRGCVAQPAPPSSARRGGQGGVSGHGRFN